MTYYRVSIKGTIGSTEVWSVNPQFASSSIVTPGQATLQSTVQLIAAVTIPAGLNAVKSSAAMVTTYTLECRSDEGVLLATASAPLTGTQTGGTVPVGSPQTAIVLSLRSDTPGARGRGRLYWPALGLSPSYPTGRLTLAQQTSLSGAAVTYLRGIQDALKAGISPIPSAATFELAVFSQTHGGYSIINRLLVGDVLDSQRRRRDAIPESYLSATYPL